MGQSVLFKFVRVDLASFGDIQFYSGDFWFTVVSTLLSFGKEYGLIVVPLLSLQDLGVGFQIQKYNFYFKFILSLS